MPADPLPPRWLSLIGLGEDGAEGLSNPARARLGQAAIIYGGERHFALADGLIKGERRLWPKPFEAAFAQIQALRGQEVAILASGDPFWFGAGASLARVIAPEEMQVFPAPSAFSLAAARLGWALQEVTTLSLHGRAFDALLPHLRPGARLLALSWDETTPEKIARQLVEMGLGEALITVLERLGGPNERIRTQPAQAFALAEVHPLNLVAIALAGLPAREALSLLPGLEDEAFEHDGQLTKRDLRVLALSALQPMPGAMLWDIGAGAGSIGIEWLRRDPSLQAIAIEQNADRLARIGANARHLDAARLRLVGGAAPGALADLPAPDAVFIGGGLSVPGIFSRSFAALRPGGRLVAHAVTVEGEAALLAAQREFGGELCRLALSRAEPVGRFLAFKPAMPVTQWRTLKFKAGAA